VLISTILSRREKWCDTSYSGTCSAKSKWKNTPNSASKTCEHVSRVVVV
jgi:hypothetical protein